MGHHQLDTLDEQILQLIADNARIPFLEVARACNVSGAAIHQRIQKLTNLGILKGSEYVIDPEKIGYETCAYIGIYLKDPATFDAVTKALEAIPEIVECHFTTGKYDMFIKLYARNNHHLLSIIHDKLQPLGLSRTETLISFHEAIKRQMPIVRGYFRKVGICLRSFGIYLCQAECVCQWQSLAVYAGSTYNIDLFILFTVLQSFFKRRKDFRTRT